MDDNQYSNMERHAVVKVICSFRLVAYSLFHFHDFVNNKYVELSGLCTIIISMEVLISRTELDEKKASSQEPSPEKKHSQHLSLYFE